jgi:hypothetical protein
MNGTPQVLDLSENRLASLGPEVAAGLPPGLLEVGG